MQFPSVVCVLRSWWINIDSAVRIHSKAIHCILLIIYCLWVAFLDADKHVKKEKWHMFNAADDHFKSFWMVSNFQHRLMLHTVVKLPYTKLGRKHNTNTARTISFFLFLTQQSVTSSVLIFKLVQSFGWTWMKFTSYFYMKHIISNALLHRHPGLAWIGEA